MKYFQQKYFCEGSANISQFEWKTKVKKYSLITENVEQQQDKTTPRNWK